MSRAFLDSNICVYWFDKSNPDKQDKALVLLKSRPFVSSQVVIETYLACSRKLKLPAQICDENTLILCDAATVMPIEPSTFSAALSLKSKLQFSFLDSLIIASALQAECTTLYSEDLQHGQLIEGKLKIVNPFI
ncbi:MAG: PIN domain-containing protein [Cyclobacteriaceae bacterium]|nr:PIN domain-containing protein [Cyclobacteriaceae bacterium]